MGKYRDRVNSEWKGRSGLRYYRVDEDRPQNYRDDSFIETLINSTETSMQYTVALIPSMANAWWVIPVDGDHDFDEEPIGPFPTALRAVRVMTVLNRMSF